MISYTYRPVAIMGLMAKTAAVALVDVRSARRNVGTWIAWTLAGGTGLVLYHVWSYEHTQFGAVVAPRFWLPGIGLVVLWVAMAGLVFLAPDLRARDEREGISQVVDARPVSNLALIGGRLIAAVLVAWLPVAFMAVALQAGGVVVAGNEWRIGVAAEPVSLAIFVFVDAPAAMLFWGALVVLLATTLRSRLAVAFLGVGLLAFHVWLVLNTPIFLLTVVSGIANLGLPGSDILPRGIGSTDLLQRCGVVAVAIGNLALASGVCHRRDGSSRVPVFAWGCLFLLLGGTGIAAAAMRALDARAERAAWAEAHAAVADAPKLDLQRVSGRVFIEPARELVMAVDLEIRTPDETAFERLRFSLNPGIQVVSTRFNGEEVGFRHELGLLTVTAPERMAAGSGAVVSVEAKGIPDARFGYLGEAFDPLHETLLGSPAVVMGDQASLFDRRYVALTPAVGWLPVPGAHRDTGPYATRPPDLHRIDLTVSVPEGWHAAGPGRVPANGVFRFKPAEPLAGFPLFTGPFERRSRVLDGIEYEMLIHPKHSTSADYFVDGANAQLFDDNVKRRVALFPGVLYPHDSLSLVEVPGQLRRYGGGWLMDGVQGLPGVQMVPEHSFPTRRYAAEKRPRDVPENSHYFRQFMLTDMRGLNGIPLSAGLARNALPSRSCTGRDGGYALIVLLDFLTAELFRSETALVPVRWLQVGRGPAASSAAGALHRLIGTATMRHVWTPGLPLELWDRSRAFAITDLDPVASADAADILIDRGHLVSRAIMDLMGSRKVGELVRLLKQRYAGGACRIEELLAGISDASTEAASYVEHAMRGTGLPGFVTSIPRVFRLPDDVLGQPRYQILIDVRNAEAAPGVVSLNWFAGSDGDWGDSFVVAGHTSLELGLVAPTPPLELNLRTYLSLNRKNIRLALRPMETVDGVAPFVGSRPSSWQPADPGIVVDDLDAGFSLVWREAGPLRLANRHKAGQSTVVVPEYSHVESATGWRRQEDELTVSWGRYRRTLVRASAGTGHVDASFSTDLPQPGVWQLSYHLPGPRASHGVAGWGHPDFLGTLQMEVIAGDLRSSVTFDGATAEQGWNFVGTFDLPAGPAIVVVSDLSDGDIVVADAVRWQPERKRSN